MILKHIRKNFYKTIGFSFIVVIGSLSLVYILDPLGRNLYEGITTGGFIFLLGSTNIIILQKSVRGYYAVRRLLGNRMNGIERIKVRTIKRRLSKNANKEIDNKQLIVKIYYDGKCINLIAEFDMVFMNELELSGIPVDIKLSTEEINLFDNMGLIRTI